MRHFCQFSNIAWRSKRRAKKVSYVNCWVSNATECLWSCSYPYFSQLPWDCDKQAIFPSSLRWKQMMQAYSTLGDAVVRAYGWGKKKLQSRISRPAMSFSSRLADVPNLEYLLTPSSSPLLLVRISEDASLVIISVSSMRSFFKKIGYENNPNKYFIYCIFTQ